MAKDQYKPGQRVPESGIVREKGPRGGDKGNHATVVDGEPFPPTSGSGNTWEYDTVTPRKK